MKKYFWLFYVNLFISSFTFGGGYVVVPMIRKFFVDRKKLFSEEELLNMAAIAQSTPGAIAINLSSLAGYRTGGIPGACVSCLGALLPPLLILSAISVGYEAFSHNLLLNALLKGMQAGAAALIVDFIVDMAQAILKEKKLLLTVLAPAAFLANLILGVNPAVILISCAFLCMIMVLIQKKKGVW